MVTAHAVVIIEFPVDALPLEIEASEIVLAVGIIVGRERLEPAYLLQHLETIGIG